MAPVPTVFFVFLAILVHVHSAKGADYPAEVTDTINKFRELMGAELYQDYMKSDDFLITWLKTQNMDIPRAQVMLRNHLEWRKENQIDGIMKEDMGTFSKLFEVGIKGIDKEGRPVFIVYYGAWDVRRVVLAGQGAKYQRYLAQQLENAAQRMRAVNASSPTGNITQILFIMDGNGYNLRTHACIQCIPQYVAFLNMFESNYPFLANKMILINVPRIGEAILGIVRPLLNPETQKRFFVYGPAKDQWRKVLLQLIDEDQLPVRLGGKAP